MLLAFQVGTLLFGCVQQVGQTDLIIRDAVFERARRRPIENTCRIL